MHVSAFHLSRYINALINKVCSLLWWQAHILNANSAPFFQVDAPANEVEEVLRECGAAEAACGPMSQVCLGCWLPEYALTDSQGVLTSRGWT